MPHGDWQFHALRKQSSDHVWLLSLLDNLFDNKPKVYEHAYNILLFAHKMRVGS